jgi:membrane-bound lytic murein transglycosylase D
LALTSYNHGAGGMLRATEALGTKDIDVIVQKYKGAAFGFASRNFYASFLAALEIDSNPGRYFGKVKMDAPIAYDVIAVQKNVSAKALARGAGISVEELKLNNPALLGPVWSGDKYIPQGYPVRVPESQLKRPLESTVAALSSDDQSSQQKPDRLHRVAAGDSLSSIARRYGTSVSQLMALNGLHNQSIPVGKSLVLPGSMQREPLSAEHVASTRAGLSSGKTQEYVIRSGDSLWSIARRFKVSPQQLQAWNDISSEDPLKPGQKLKISNA